MRTSNKISCTKGEVHVNHGANGGVISTTIVTDDRAQGNCVEGGAECRDATPEEVQRATENGMVRHIAY
jgi:hypothetical protein